MNKRKLLQDLSASALIFAGLYLILSFGVLPLFTPEPVQDGLPINFEIHVTMEHRRDGELIAWDHHAGTLTTLGKNYIEDQLGDSAGNEAKWIALSNSTDAPAAGWTSIPDEISTGDMNRTRGTYQNHGDGVWNITYTFSPTEANATRLTGLYYGQTGNLLMAADTFAVVNYANGDSVKITWQITVS